MTLRARLLLSLGVVLALNLAIGLYAFQAYQRVATSAEQVGGWANRIVSTSLSAQLYFGKQVQEWKNVLLRGHEPALYDKYLRQLYEEERSTRREIESLLQLLEVDSDLRRTADAVHQAHGKLGVEYRGALAFHDRAAGRCVFVNPAGVKILKYDKPGNCSVKRGIRSFTTPARMVLNIPSMTALRRALAAPAGRAGWTKRYSWGADGMRIPVE